MQLSHPLQFDDRFVAASKRFSRVAAGSLVLIGALVLTGWLLDINRLKSLYGDITMKANAALSLLLAGLSLWALNSDAQNSLVRRAGRVAAVLVTTIGALTLSQHLFGWNFGIDELLFIEPAGAPATMSPGRMGLPASTCFTLSGISLLLFYARRATSLAQLLAIVVCLWAMLALVGYVYGAEQLYGVARYTGIALLTAVSFLLLSSGLLAARVTEELISVISSGRAGGMMARRLLLAAVVVPVILGWFRIQGEHAGYYGPAFGAALRTLSSITIFAWLIWYVAARLNHVERQRMEAEAAAGEREKARQEQYALTKIITDNANTAIFMMDAEGKITFANPAAEAMTGFTFAELEGHVFHDMVHQTHPGGRSFPISECSIGRSVMGLQTLSNHEDVFVRKDGTSFPVRCSGSPIIKEGALVGIVLEAQDVTELKCAEAERERLLREAEEANRLKDEFLATASHELRTPLNAILGWTQMLRQDKLDSAASARALEVIARNAKAQAKLIEDLLDISRIITGKLTLHTQPLQMSAIVADAANTVRPAAEAKNICLHLSLDHQTGPVLGDADRLQQVVWNLLSNAVKFTPAGGRMEVVLRQLDSHAELCVRDTGQGISAEFLPYVFDRFRQADGTTTRRHGGLGLGLSIVRHLVEMHGGTVRAHSKGEGRGAAFYLRLPLLGIHRNEPPALAASPEKQRLPSDTPETSLPRLNGVRVLVVDDDPDTREMVEAALRQYQVEVVAAASAAEALRQIEQQRPDVLVSDIGMPDEDGYQLVRKIRAMEIERGSAELPALALTAYAKDEDRQQALAAGYQEHLVKPVTPYDVAEAVARLARRASELRR